MPDGVGLLHNVKTYRHGFKVLVEFLGDLVHKFAASYPGAAFRPVEGRNLPLQSARNTIDRPMALTWADPSGYPRNLRQC